ncbi:hypothetical protein ACFPYI_03280 [Halomarina salina]|uniref:Uncharacterized protein n=1 Tax=Halomarina salina TaxID=1872699 RepID=A0ABD5RIH2_9EURY|nr:hypothetical protein [Halomarina salina]
MDKTDTKTIVRINVSEGTDDFVVDEIESFGDWVRIIPAGHIEVRNTDENSESHKESEEVVSFRFPREKVDSIRVVRDES